MAAGNGEAMPGVSMLSTERHDRVSRVDWPTLRIAKAVIFVLDIMGRLDLPKLEAQAT